MGPRRRGGRSAPLLACLLAAAVTLRCGSTPEPPPPRLDDPPLAMTLTVTGLREEERAAFRDEVCKMPGVSSCTLEPPPPPPEPEPAPVDEPKAAEAAKKPKKPKKPEKPEKEEPEAAPEAPPEEPAFPSGLAPPAAKGTAILKLTYKGSLGELRHKIAALAHPGLEAKTAVVALDYRGFDNQPPNVTIVEPVDGLTTAKEYVDVIINAPDNDLAFVRIDGKDALPLSGGRFAGPAELVEGENIIVIRVGDHDENATEKSIRVVVDTTPPALQVEVVVVSDEKVIVKGTVGDAASLTLDGKPLSSSGGKFMQEIKVDPDKNVVEIVALDALGNTARIKRSTRVASALSAESM